MPRGVQPLAQDVEHLEELTRELKQQLVALPPQQLVPQPLVVPQQQQPTVYGLGPAPPLPVYIGPGAPAPYPATYQQQGIVYHR